MVVRLSHRKRPDLASYRLDALGRAFSLAGQAVGLRRNGRLTVPDKIPYSLAFQNVTHTKGVAPVGNAFFDIPSLADERATYDRLGWTRTGSDETIDFAAVAPDVSGFNDPHNDLEADDLWTWFMQERRGHDPAKTAAWRATWLSYYKNNFLAALTAHNTWTDVNSSEQMCHAFGEGLCAYGAVMGDSSAIAAAEAIGNYVINSNAFHGVYPSPTTTVRRETARPALLWAYLAAATTGASQTKWAGWRDAAQAMFLNADNWNEAGVGGGTQPRVGGFYPATRIMIADGWDHFGNNIQDGLNAYDAGYRIQQSWEMGIQIMAMLAIYRQTLNTSLRDRIVKFARFIAYYGHDPLHTVPFVGTVFGHNNGARYHGDADNHASSQYDLSVINALTWGYKLTNDQTLYDRATTHLRQGVRWRGIEPANSGAGPLCSTTEVLEFLDTRADSANEYKLFLRNKGALQYASDYFENGGAPTVLSTLSPLETKAATLGTSTEASRWGEVTGMAGTSALDDAVGIPLVGNPGVGHIITYADKLAWDPQAKRIWFTGSDDGGGGRRVAYYSLDTNAWTSVTGGDIPWTYTPSQAQSANHVYAMHDFDPARRRWYVADGVGQNLYIYNANTGAWGASQPNPSGGNSIQGDTSGFAFFPERDSLFWLWNPLSATSQLYERAQNGTYTARGSTIPKVTESADCYVYYNRKNKCVVYGSGGVVRKIDINGAITNLDNMPSAGNTKNWEWAENAATGIFDVLFYSGGRTPDGNSTKKHYTFDPAATTGSQWTNVGTTGIPNDVFSEDYDTDQLNTVACVMPEYKVQVFLTRGIYWPTKLFLRRYA